MPTSMFVSSSYFPNDVVHVLPAALEICALMVFLSLGWIANAWLHNVRADPRLLTATVLIPAVMYAFLNS